jgi:hypothetical protein
VLDRGAQAVAAEKNNSADLQRKRVKITGLRIQLQRNPRGDVPSASSIR